MIFNKLKTEESKKQKQQVNLGTTPQNNQPTKKDFQNKGLGHNVIRYVMTLVVKAGRLVTVNFLKSLGWILGIFTIVFLLVIISSVGTTVYRGSTFKSYAKWKFERIDVNKKNSNFINTEANTIFTYNKSGWRATPLSGIDEGAFYKKNNKIALINISGIIMPDCYSSRTICPGIIEDLTDYLATNKEIKGVVILLDSPGGEVYSSEAIYNAIKRLSKVKPVYVYVKSTSASGAYYASLGATKIYASPVSIIGSIGVYMEVFNYDGLLQKLGIKHKYIVSSHANYKITDKWLFDEGKEAKYVQKYMQNLIDESEKVFWQRVKENRANVPLEKLQGLVFASNQALKYNLIDGVYDTYLDVITDMLKNEQQNVKTVVVVEYALSTFNGYRLLGHNIVRLLAGGSSYYLMWK